MPRRDDKQSARLLGTDELLSLQQRLFLAAAMSTARNPYQPSRRVIVPHGAAALGDVGGDREIKLQVAGNMRVAGVGAERAKATGVGLALRGDHDTLRKGLAE